MAELRKCVMLHITGTQSRKTRVTRSYRQRSVGCRCRQRLDRQRHSRPARSRAQTDIDRAAPREPDAAEGGMGWRARGSSRGLHAAQFELVQILLHHGVAREAILE